VRLVQGGMNNDKTEEDARLVVQRMDLKYRTVKAGSTRGDYGVRAYPTVLILDGKGVVRDFHTGYAPDLKQKLIQKIDQLLGK
jgi:hypothetical protein